MALFLLAFSSYIRSAFSSCIRSALSSYIRSAYSSYIANFNFNCRQESSRSAESAVIRIPWLMLQGSTLDVLEGHQMVSTVKSKIIATRNDDIEFDKVYGNMLGMAKRAGMDTLDVPRICGRQT